MGSDTPNIIEIGAKRILELEKLRRLLALENARLRRINAELQDLVRKSLKDEGE